MPPFPLTAFLTAPLLFPSHHPVAVWIGLASLAVGALVMWKADDLGSSETTLRADEAAQWLRCMSERRVG